MSHPDEYAPPHSRVPLKPAPADPQFPAFLRRAAMADGTATPQNLDDLQRDLEAETARQNQIARWNIRAMHADDPTLALPPLAGLKALLAHLTYGDMKAAAGDIGKHAGLDTDKLADAMHKYATDEEAA